MDEFPCLRRTARGRILHCPDLQRILLDYDGAWFIFRLPEFLGFHRHIARMAACPFARSRLAGSERLQVRSLSGSTMAIDLAGVQELASLMDAAIPVLEASNRFPNQEI